MRSARRSSLVARLDRHLAHGLEFLAGDDVHVLEELLRLGAHDRLDLAPGACRRAKPHP